MTTRATNGSSPGGLNRENLLERVLIARPNASPDEIRRMAAPFTDVPEGELLKEMDRMRQRIAGKAARRKRS
jgi:hypothetical protein